MGTPLIYGKSYLTGGKKKIRVPVRRKRKKGWGGEVNAWGSRKDGGSYIEFRWASTAGIRGRKDRIQREKKVEISKWGGWSALEKGARILHAIPQESGGGDRGQTFILREGGNGELVGDRWGVLYRRLINDRPNYQSKDNLAQNG